MRNFVSQVARETKLSKTLASIDSYDGTVTAIHQLFTGNKIFRDSHALVRAAEKSGKIAGLNDFGQLVHLLKNKWLKIREQDAETLLANAKKFLACFNVNKVVQLAQELADTSGGIRYLDIDATPAQLKAACALERDKVAHARAVRNLLEERTALSVRNLPEVGLLLDDAEFLRSFDNTE